MIEDEEGFERFQDLVRAIEKSVDQPDVAAKRQEIEKKNSEIRWEIDGLSIEEVQDAIRGRFSWFLESTRLERDKKVQEELAKAEVDGRFSSVNPWEAAKARDEERARLTGKLIEAEQEELISHANREDLFRSMQIRASNQQLCEAVMRERLWARLEATTVRLCDDKGVESKLTLTQKRFARQDWHELRMGKCDDLWILVDEPNIQEDASKAVAKPKGRPGRKIEYQLAYDFLKKKMKSGEWTHDEGGNPGVYDENREYLGREKLNYRLQSELGDGQMPSDFATALKWPAKIAKELGLGKMK